MTIEQFSKLVRSYMLKNSELDLTVLQQMQVKKDREIVELQKMHPDMTYGDAVVVK